jgi:hypothetical protein
VSEIEALVIRSVRERLKLTAPIDDRSLINTYIARIEVESKQLVIWLAQVQATKHQWPIGKGVLYVPWHKTPSKQRREILLPDGIEPEHARAIRSETRATLVASIARGRRWLEELVASPTADAEAIAKREGCSIRKINMTVSLAFLAPDLFRAAIEGRACPEEWEWRGFATCPPNGRDSTRCWACLDNSAITN